MADGAAWRMADGGWKNVDDKNNYTRKWLAKIPRNKDEVKVQSKDRFVQRIVAVG